MSHSSMILPASNEPDINDTALTSNEPFINNDIALVSNEPFINNDS